MEKPDQRWLDPRLNLSCADVGVLAQPGRLIEIRAREPGVHPSRCEWDRVYITPEAADTLVEWLEEAIERARS